MGPWPGHTGKAVCLDCGTGEVLPEFLKSPLTGLVVMSG